MAEQVYFDNVAEGQEIPKLVKNCSSQQLVMWAAGSGDFYQIHYDKDFAQGTGLKGIIVHGALKNAFLGQLLHGWAGEKGSVKRFSCQYRGMDYPTQDIICRGVVTKKYQEGGQNLVDLDIWTENPEGQKTSPGKAVVALPSKGG
jgi:acyl dehydratase